MHDDDLFCALIRLNSSLGQRLDLSAVTLDVWQSLTVRGDAPSRRRDDAAATPAVLHVIDVAQRSSPNKNLIGTRDVIGAFGLTGQRLFPSATALRTELVLHRLFGS